MGHKFRQTLLPGHKKAKKRRTFAASGCPKAVAASRQAPPYTTPLRRMKQPYGPGSEVRMMQKARLAAS